MLPAGDAGASSSHPFPRCNVDLNRPPREEVGVPVDKAPGLDLNRIPSPSPEPEPEPEPAPASSLELRLRESREERLRLLGASEVQRQDAATLLRLKGRTLAELERDCEETRERVEVLRRAFHKRFR